MECFSTSRSVNDVSCGPLAKPVEYHAAHMRRYLLSDAYIAPSLHRSTTGALLYRTKTIYLLHRTKKFFIFHRTTTGHLFHHETTVHILHHKTARRLMNRTMKLHLVYCTTTVLLLLPLHHHFRPPPVTVCFSGRRHVCIWIWNQRPNCFPTWV